MKDQSHCFLIACTIENIDELVKIVECYVTENRLRNVLSKNGPIKIEEITKLVRLLSNDTLTDFIKDNKDYSIITDKQLTKN